MNAQSILANLSNRPLNPHKLMMGEILHQLIGYPMICKVLYIPGGAGFLPEIFWQWQDWIASQLHWLLLNSK